jgi:CrcB protein
MLSLYIALGGAVGALARYGLGGLIQTRTGSTFPWGTFVVNAVGSLLIGFLLRVLESVAATAETRALLTVGFLGAFTTFSTFSYEAAMLLQSRAWASAAVYTAGSVVLGLTAVVVGLWLGSVFLLPRS